MHPIRPCAFFLAHQVPEDSIPPHLLALVMFKLQRRRLIPNYPAVWFAEFNPLLSDFWYVRFSPVQMKALLKQLLEILAFIHENKYVHRDIKCSNLLIDNNLQLKVRVTNLLAYVVAALFCGRPAALSGKRSGAGCPFLRLPNKEIASLDFSGCR